MTSPDAPQTWTADRVTARDVVSHRDVHLLFWCEGCRITTHFDVWKIGARLADQPLRELRFRCRRCGVYATTLEVSRQTGAQCRKLLAVRIQPRAWDDGCREDQEAALMRAAARRGETWK